MLTLFGCHIVLWGGNHAFHGMVTRKNRAPRPNTRNLAMGSTISLSRQSYGGGRSQGKAKGRSQDKATERSEPRESYGKVGAKGKLRNCLCQETQTLQDHRGRPGSVTELAWSTKHYTILIQAQKNDHTPF